MTLLRRTMLIALACSAVACMDEPSTGPAPSVLPEDPSPGLYSIGDLARPHLLRPCRWGAYRGFDFWLGKWDVESPPGSGSLAGTNEIRSELDGCVIAEYWTGSNGIRGWSLNSWDARTRTWNQHWVAESGQNLRMSGPKENGAITMSGVRLLPSGATVIDRTTWTPVANGGVTQFWDVSSDGGITYPTVVFNGLYHPNPDFMPAAPPGTTSCMTPNYGSADFMIGSWRVSSEHGLKLGHSDITSELSHCLLLERFANRFGYEWKSFLSYGRVYGQWFRTSVDTEGERLGMEGTAQDGSIVVTGPTGRAFGPEVLLRVTYTPVGADEFTSLWETSRNDGATWRTDRRLVYRRTH